jgi:Dimerisation domain/O-methyltransferase domain
MPANPMEYLWPGIIAAQAIYTAAKLRIPDLLASGPKTVAELASESGAHAPSLEHLLRALSTLDMFTATPEGRYRNTPVAELLRTDHPQSQRGGALFLPAPFLWQPLGDLHESVRTGEPAFPRVFKQRFFDYLAAHPADAADGTLLLIERIVDTGSHTSGLMGLLMLVIGGRERTEAEFRSILAASGFSLTRIVAPGTSSVLECHPI